MPIRRWTLVIQAANNRVVEHAYVLITMKAPFSLWGVTKHWLQDGF